MTRSVLFVCTGNTCRSPMAEQLFSRLCREAGVDLSVSSAGVEAAAGMPLSRGAAAVFAARGIGPVAHREALIARFPDAASRIFALRESDIADPAGTAPAEYELSAASIEEALKSIVTRERETHAPNPR